MLAAGFELEVVEEKVVAVDPEATLSSSRRFSKITRPVRMYIAKMVVITTQMGA